MSAVMKGVQMKKTGLLLTGMLVVTGCLTYAWRTLPRQESDLYVQEDVGARQEEQESAEQVVRREREEGYAYSMLPVEEQELYMEIRDALTQFQEDVKLSSCDKEQISHVFQCVLNDHPEIFYVEGYTYTEYTLGDILRKITFTGSYRYDQAEIAEKQRQIDNYVNQCLSGMPAGADDYTKVKYIYEYLIHHTEYDAAAEDNQNICSVFIEGRSVCQGYAKATQYLLNQAGVPTTLVLGRVVGGEGHAWNLVQVEGQYYYVDTTWGDASYQAVGGAESYPGEKIPTINYDYLCVSTEQLNLTHTLDNVVELPECTSMAANYYVREGFYFTEWNEEQVERIFREEYEKGSAYVTLKCMSADVYRQMEDALITRQEVFRYLNCPEGVVSYSDNEEQFSMSFWL